MLNTLLSDAQPSLRECLPRALLLPNTVWGVVPAWHVAGRSSGQLLKSGAIGINYSLWLQHCVLHIETAPQEAFREKLTKR